MILFLLCMNVVFMISFLDLIPNDHEARFRGPSSPWLCRVRSWNNGMRCIPHNWACNYSSIPYFLNELRNARYFRKKHDSRFKTFSVWICTKIYANYLLCFLVQKQQKEDETTYGLFTPCFIIPISRISRGPCEHWLVKKIKQTRQIRRSALLHPNDAKYFTFI